MPALSMVSAANAALRLSYLPVAVFVGGTSGIGRATAQAFARYTKGNAHIVLVGRNKAAADAVLAGFPSPTAPGATHEFIACDAELLSNVDATTSTLRERLPKINFLVLTAGMMSFKGREETAEGIDRRLGLHYYARWKFVRDLLPLLRRARDAGEDAKAMSVLAAGHLVQFDVDNLGLKRDYLRSNPGFTSPAYTDLMMQSFAEQEPGISFIHANPGGVRTSLLERAHWTMRLLNPLLITLLYPVTVSPEQCGEYMLYSLLQSGEGVQRRSSRGDDIGRSPLYDDEERRRRLWEHTEEEVRNALQKSEPS